MKGKEKMLWNESDQWEMFAKLFFSSVSCAVCVCESECVILLIFISMNAADYY